MTTDAQRVRSPADFLRLAVGERSTAPGDLPMQLGNLVVGTRVGLAIAWAYGDWWMAPGVVVATVSKLGTEKLGGARWPTTS